MVSPEVRVRSVGEALSFRDCSTTFKAVSHLFHLDVLIAVPADSNRSEIGQFGQGLFVLRTLGADSSATLPTVVLSRQHAESVITDVAVLHHRIDPNGSLSLLESIDPLQEVRDRFKLHALACQLLLGLLHVQGDLDLHLIALKLVVVE